MEETPKISFKERVENPETVAATSVPRIVSHKKAPLVGSLLMIIRGIIF